MNGPLPTWAIDEAFRLTDGVPAFEALARLIAATGKPRREDSNVVRIRSVRA